MLNYKLKLLNHLNFALIGGMEMIVYQSLAVMILLVTLPMQLIIGLVIAITSGFPVLYGQQRVGLNGKIFTLIKFRTMAFGAEKLQSKYRALNEADGPVFKIRNDPRFTPVGRFLSHTGLDELPQFWNVLRGEMALIGPRPLPVDEAKKLKSWQKKREVVLPGIISPWILEGHHRISFNDWMRSDIAYVRNKSLSFDARFFLRVIFFTIGLLFREMRVIK